MNGEQLSLAVHLHLYYVDMWPEIKDYLSNIGEYAYDLYVTLSAENPELEAEIKKFKPEAQVWVVENRGYDVGAFVYFLNHIRLSDYDYILKIHTKNTTRDVLTHVNHFYLKNSEWSKLLWDGVLKTRERVKEIIELLSDESVGMVGSWFLVTKTLKNTNQVTESCHSIMRKMGFVVPKKIAFIPGTMFWVKSKLMEPIKNNFQLTDFEESGASGVDGSMAHAMERVFGSIVDSRGYQIKGVGFEFLSAFLLAIRPFLRFCFQKKITHNGKMIIKVLKLPVFRKVVNRECRL